MGFFDELDYEEVLHYIMWYLPGIGKTIAILLIICAFLACCIPKMVEKSDKNMFTVDINRAHRIKKGPKGTEYKLE